MRLSLLLSVLPLALAGPTGKRSEPAPLLVPRGAAADLISNEYIVKFKEGSALAALEDALKLLPGKPLQKFDSIFKGFSGNFDKSTVDLLRLHPDVEFIEHNAKVTASGFRTQSGAPWGLGRISHRSKGSNQYVYDDSAGEGVCAYIIDSGLDDSHPDFEGRAEEIKSFIGGSGDNCGHGTHVAGTIGSKTYGVAKNVQLYGIKTLDYNPSSGKCEADNSIIIAGMEYVSKDVANRNCPNGVVINMSLGGGYSQASNDAAAALVRKGYFVAVAAGNENRDARNSSPASETSVCTVGGSQIDDKRYVNSNYGPVVDIIGPAVNVLSTVPGGRTASYTGTSMATPHIAGLAAYLASLEGTRASPAMCQRIRDLATKNAITNQTPNTVNLLAFNGAT